MITHVLDSSAVLAHYFHEAGAEEVDRLLQEQIGTIGLSVVSWPELATRLKAIVPEDAEAAHAFRLYTEVVSRPLPITVAVARRAIELRNASGSRLPLVDALIAASAAVEDAVLVHRDPHFGGIPTDRLRQLPLSAPRTRARR